MKRSQLVERRTKKKKKAIRGQVKKQNKLESIKCFLCTMKPALRKSPSCCESVLIRCAAKRNPASCLGVLFVVHPRVGDGSCRSLYSRESRSFRGNDLGIETYGICSAIWWAETRGKERRETEMTLTLLSFVTQVALCATRICALCYNYARKRNT